LFFGTAIPKARVDLKKLLLVYKLGRIDAERLAQLKDRRKAGFNLIPFDPDELSRRNPGSLGKLLLGHEFPDPLSLDALPDFHGRQYIDILLPFW